MPTPQYPLPTDRGPGDGRIITDLNQAYRNINDLDERAQTIDQAAQSAADAADEAGSKAAAALDAALQLTGGGLPGFGIDTDGVPYFNPGGSESTALLLVDTDGQPYYIGA